MKPVRKQHLKLFEFDSEEKLLGEVPRSQIGLIFIFINGLMITVLVLVMLFYAVRYETELKNAVNISDNIEISGALSIIFGLVILLIFLGSLAAAYVYVNSYIILTDQKLVLINTRGIFARRVSQLSIGDVQDITVDQNSFLSRVFKYGNINIETAGEQANFTFSFAENPNENGKYIVDAHEQNLKLYGN